MQTEFRVADTDYRADRLDAFKQLHVSRKIAPMIPKLIPVFLTLQKGEADGDVDSLGALMTAAGPFADALAAMPEADVDFVVKTCLGVVKRNAGGAWSPLVINGTLMYSDMGLDDMLPIVVQVLRENLGNFMRGLLANSPGVPPAPAAQ